jgi:hypothetical protein
VARAFRQLLQYNLRLATHVDEAAATGAKGWQHTLMKLLLFYPNESVKKL